MPASSTFDKISQTQITQPKGGGTIHGIGDSFKADSFSGTGSFNIQLPLTPGRGFDPDLSVEYNSGFGNGTFGLGFSLNLPKVSVRTDKGIPKYDRNQLFVLPSGEEAVKKISTEKNSSRKADDTNTVEYLPRVESLFSKIQQITDNGTGISYWKITSNNNVIQYYGRTDNSRIVNPDNELQIFQWLIDESCDAHGNRIIYTYKQEDSANVPQTPSEKNRSSTANRYIQNIKYGNYFDGDIEKFAFEIVFDYGEYNLTIPGTAYKPVAIWQCRPDSFSSYKSGFEIRTHRLCQNIMLFHHFENELQTTCLIKSFDFNYQNLQNYNGIEFYSMSMLTNSAVTGYRKRLDGSFDLQKMPPIELNYSSFIPPQSPAFKTLQLQSGALPGYLNGSEILPVDLNGEGLPGFLYSSQGTIVYMQPEGNGNYSPAADPEDFPSFNNLLGGDISLQDIDGNGQLELLINTASSAGYYKRNDQGGWNDFRSFANFPTDFANENMENADLGANGKTDMLLADTSNILVYPSAGEMGFRPGVMVPNENGFPLKKNDYKQELVTFLDIYGDGLPHRVKIASGVVECWPCLGYGKYSQKVTMENAPVFDTEFDIGRVFFADIDGSGTSDLIYAYSDRVEIFLNQNGNSFSDAVRINLPDQFTDIDRISFSDLMGNGTSSLVFTKIAPVPVHYYYNFIGETISPEGAYTEVLKPYLLNQINNNLGAKTHILYSSSTKYYLEDKKLGTPWITKLPFPVQVVDRVIVTDIISGSRYVNKFKYHQGYYDPVEREFCGFGYIESWDSEFFPENEKASTTRGTISIPEDQYVAPVYTRIWHHTGSCTDPGVVSRQYVPYYYSGDKNAYNFPDSVFQEEIYMDQETVRQAYFALKGHILRKEVYASDGKPESVNPYTVDESNFQVMLQQTRGHASFAVFQVNARESIAYNYERNPYDPRVSQDFVLETDPLNGEIKKSVSVFLPRRLVTDPEVLLYPEQQVLKAILKSNLHINTSDDLDYRYRGIEYDNREYELLGILLDNDKRYFSFENIKDQADTAQENILPYLADFLPGGLQVRQLTWETCYFWDDKQSDFLSVGNISKKALVHHVAEAVFTPANISLIFQNKLAGDLLQDIGGYFFDVVSGYWQNRGLVQHYFTDPKFFYLPCLTENSFVDSSSQLFQKATIVYDNYNLVPVCVTMYLDDNTFNTTSVVLDYQTMKPAQIIDANQNMTQLLFDPLGNVVVSTIFGMENGIATGGMRLYETGSLPAEYIIRDSTGKGQPISFDDVLANPEYYLQGAGSYFFYDLNAFFESNEDVKPVNSISLQRENYYHLNGDTTPFSCDQLINFWDGFARKIESKQLADPDYSVNVKKRTKANGYGSRWLVSGRIVYNNKEKPCEEFLPYFSDLPFYEKQDEIPGLPAPTITCYDPLLRMIRVDTPKGFFSLHEFTSWEEKISDENDTVKDSAFYISFMANYPVQPDLAQKNEMDALVKAEACYHTPTIEVFDNFGNAFLKIQIRTDGPQLISFLEYDIEGRVTRSVDPRFYKSNLEHGTAYSNFRYIYPMGGSKPVFFESADAGTKLHFNNIFENQFWSWSPRDYCQLISYDRMQRKIAVKVKKADSAIPLVSFDDFSLVEVFAYGEFQPEPEKYNLRGEVYQINDLSGVLIKSLYSISGHVLKSSRQMAENYKIAVNWTEHIMLETEINNVSYTFDALGRLINETTSDGSITTNTYNLSGLLDSVTVQFSDGIIQKIINQIIYNANRQRVSISYGNGIGTFSTYEDTTHRLLNLLSKKTGGDKGIISTVQDISYTYDPVGNITRTWDHSIETVFNNNQQVSPLSDYTYDEVYRLIKATGRQHPGINGGTYRNNSSDGSFKQSMFSPLPSINDSNKLENYTENYQYDDGGNLIEKQHFSPSVSYTTDQPVVQDSNRLQGLGYDASGNPLQLAINNTVSLSFNCYENLVKAAVIERPGMNDDSDYYIYDSSEMRTRKVIERMNQGGAITSVTEKTYIGNYEIKRQKTVDQKGNITVTLERRTLRIMDDKTCVAIIHYWTKDDQHREVDSVPCRSFRYQMDNDLGSVTMEYDENALLISYEEYFPYGGTAIIAGSNQKEVKIKSYRYSGKECDDSTGLYYYGARYYISWMGRWLNPDPGGNIDGLNLYEFVSGNPITFTDPTGFGKVYIGNKKDTTALLKGLRFIKAAEFEKALGLANKVYDEAHADKKLFTDESVRFSPPLETELNVFLNKFKGAFSAFNPSLHSAIVAAGGYSEEASGNVKNKYSGLRSNATKTMGDGFPDIDFTPQQGNKTFELHHLMYKSMFPTLAMTTGNFAAATRGSASSGLIGTHEGVFHLITSGNDSSIYSRAIAGVSGLFKRIIKKTSPKARWTRFIANSKAYSVYANTPTSNVRSKSARLQLLEAKKREKNGGTTEFIKLKSIKKK